MVPELWFWLQAAPAEIINIGVSSKGTFIMVGMAGTQLIIYDLKGWCCWPERLVLLSSKVGAVNLKGLFCWPERLVLVMLA